MANELDRGGAAKRTPTTILEDLAVGVMSVDAADEAGVSRLITLFDELALAEAELAGPARAVAERLRTESFDVRRLASALDTASEEVAKLQDRLARAGRPESLPAPGAAAGNDDAFVLPEWGDEKTLSDFLAAQRGGLEELEGMILGMERGDPDSRAAFKRRLHTLKGEAGVLALVDLERVCHATEDFLEARGVSAEVTDRLLKVRDWMAGALESYGRMRLPKPRGEEIAVRVLLAGAKAESKNAAPKKAKVEPPPPAPAPAPVVEAAPKPAAAAVPVWDAPLPSERVDRDAETVGLFGEFLSESAEGLNRVDQILMNVERDGINADTVNSLFRVFHTIKGTAGFLELVEVVSLAHETETMLNKCREKVLELEGVVIDLVFDATSALREMLEGVRVAVEAGTGFARREGLEALVRSIQDATEGRAVAEHELPVAGKGERLGDVITHPPISVPPEAVAMAAERQVLTGRRLGEELVAIGAAEPAQVAQALRAQNRARESGEPEQTVKLKDTIKVDLERVDSLVEMIGELVVVEAMVVNAPEIAKTTSVRVRNCLGQLAKVTRDLQDVGMRMRMVPVASVFQKMARMVRDLSRRSGKQVNLVTSGESTEMDRSMVERIADPLVHMIRNACDHGLEPSDERLAASKPAVGQIKLSAYHESGSVIIELADDGRGLNKPAILKKAIEKGLITSADGMSDDEIHGLIFAPGFSTAAKVTEISGRGVGMDVVKRNIDALRGRVVISSVPGAGTRFKLVLPLTLAIIDGMLVACGKERYIIPTLSIVESIKPDAKMLVSFAQKNEMINLRGEILPLLRLDRLFDLPGAKTDPSEALVVVVEAMGRRIGLLVDEVVTQQQVVIKTLGEGMGRTHYLAGAAILSDGQVGLILNVDEMAGLIHKSVNYFRDRTAALPPPAEVALTEAKA
jgi:two-component system, chemotaxis family, sensor kinase CheA